MGTRCYHHDLVKGQLLHVKVDVLPRFFSKALEALIRFVFFLAVCSENGEWTQVVNLNFTLLLLLMSLFNILF